MDPLEHITEETIKRYSDRFSKLGENVKSLGWGTREQQAYRFSQTVFSDFGSKTILDIGCGFCDYYSFLKEIGNAPAKYIGWDINEDLLQVARKRFGTDEKVEIRNESIAGITGKNGQDTAHIGVMLGVLNFNLRNKGIDNYNYSKLLITNAFKLVNEVLIVDFLSSYRTPEYAPEDFVFYHDPAVMLDFALNLSSNAVLKHNYDPIPQKEFMLFIYK